MDRFRCKFAQYWRFSSCDLWKDGHQLMPAHRRARRHQRGSAAGSAASPCRLPAHQVLEIWLQLILLPACSRSPPQRPAWGAGEKAAAATTSRGRSAHPEVVCPSLPSLPHPSVWHQPHSPVGTPARGQEVKCGAKKRQKISVCPTGQGR